MSKVIARFRVDPPKYIYVIYTAGSERVIGRYYSRRDAKRAARELSKTFEGLEYLVVKEDNLED